MYPEINHQFLTFNPALHFVKGRIASQDENPKQNQINIVKYKKIVLDTCHRLYWNPIWEMGYCLKSVYSPQFSYIFEIIRKMRRALEFLFFWVLTNPDVTNPREVKSHYLRCKWSDCSLSASQPLWCIFPGCVCGVIGEGVNGAQTGEIG